jgi:hypothetical protein
MNASPLRDSRIGRLLAARAGTRPLQQAELGGTAQDNIYRLADWRNRIARVPLEEMLKPIYSPIPRYLSLVVLP